MRSRRLSPSESRAGSRLRAPHPLARLLVLVAVLAIAPVDLVQAAPEVGKPAPPFVFEGEVDGVRRTFRSADYVGESARKKGVVVAWFPKAFTPG